MKKRSQPKKHYRKIDGKFSSFLLKYSVFIYLTEGRLSSLPYIENISSLSLSCYSNNFRNH